MRKPKITVIGAGSASFGLTCLRGVCGVSVGALPQLAAEFCNRQKLIVDLAVKAAVEGDRKAAVRALAIDPMVDDLESAERIVEDGLNTFKKYLPAFS